MQRISVVILLTVALSGCVTLSDKAALQSAATIHNICQLYPSISYDGNRDTKLTKDQIKRFNRARAALCKGDK